ncbi:hypothetical protein V5799_028648 [Amblyomma americanum]|uniref:YqaJ viral recombinase domain-containing protein n=1 Tax=Amblyomma americanum TaxID=6943 RepID=A0AAQ4DC95_AMBAM
MEVVEGREIDPEKLKAPGQWFRTRKNGRLIPEKEIADDHVVETKSKDRTAARQEGRRLAAKSVEKQITRIPQDFDKIIMRPRGGIEKLLVHGGAFLANAIAEAAEVGEGSREDIITFNRKQQSIMIATGDGNRREKYASLTELKIGDVETTLNAYLTPPENCAKGVIYDAPDFWTEEEIFERLEQHGAKNPPILGVRRLGKESKAVLILFDSNRVPWHVYLSPTPTSYGVKMEAVAAQRYEDVLRKMGHAPVVTSCGLLVNPDFPWLGASPNRIVYDSVEGSYGAVEIKCPYSLRDCKGHELLAADFCSSLIDNVPHLKRDHDYFYQFSGQMGISQLGWGDFLVFGRHFILIERIRFEPTEWKNVRRVLDEFYFTTLLPYLSGD